MSKIIFSKISAERDKRFRIKTSILKDDSGKYLIRKEPLQFESKEHIMHLDSSYRALTSMYHGSKFCVNKVEVNDGILNVEYLEGDTLENYVQNLYDSNLQEELFRVLKDLIEEIRKLAVIDFIITDDFKKVFGEHTFLKLYKSCPVTDIDLILSNIIVNSNGWNIIDFEWTFSFPVPIDFVLFRLIKYSPILMKLNFYDLLAFSEDELNIFEAMDQNFYNYIGTNHKSHPHMFPLKRLSSIEDLQQAYVDIKQIKNISLEQEQSIKLKDAKIKNLNLLVENYDKENVDLLNLKDVLEHEIEQLKNKNVNLIDKLNYLESSYNNLLHSRSWRLTQPLRQIGNNIKSNHFMYLVAKTLLNIKRHGIKDTYNKVVQYVKRDNSLKEQEPVIAYTDIFDNKKYAFNLIYQDNIIWSGATDIKALAFYLPQFHSFPENDEWWGKGFTEWSNTRKAKPLYQNHYQPREPHDDIGYYDLKDISTLEKQAQLLKEHHIYGLCIYYYWFSGKKLMEKPIDMLLKHPEIDIKFCLCWANENWTRTWDGEEDNVLIAQNYSDEDAYKFIEDLKKYISDYRYIKVNNKPVIIVYNPAKIPNVKNVFNIWKDEARKIGLGEITIWICKSFGCSIKDLELEGIVDKEIEFPPHNMNSEDITENINNIHGHVFNYNRLVDKIFNERKLENFNKNLYRTVMLGWDNSARRQENFTSFCNFDIQSYYKWLRININEARQKFSREDRFIFVNAWNEWAEGTYLEPDKKYGYAYLNATSAALLNKKIELSGYILNKIEDTARIAVQAHIYYDDLTEEVISYLNNIQEPYDCFITTDTIHKAQNIIELFKRQSTANKIEVTVLQNRGRDVAPFILQMQDKILHYQYFCHIHTKRSKHSDFGDRWRHFLFNDLLKDSENIKKIIEKFDHEPDLGIIAPRYFENIISNIEWGSNKPFVLRLLKRLNIDSDLSDKPDFPAGDMFWARTESVKQLFTNNFSIYDFPEEQGQVDGTIMHAVERVWFHLAAYNGYRSIFVSDENDK